MDFGPRLSDFGKGVHGFDSRVSSPRSEVQGLTSALSLFQNRIVPILHQLAAGALGVLDVREGPDLHME